MHRFIDSSTHHSFTDSFLTSSSLIHWFTDSQIYPLTNALNDYNHLFIDSLNHRFIGSLKSSTHWFIDSLNHRLATSLAFSLVHRHVIRSLHGSVVHLFNDSILHSLIHWIIGSLIDALVHWIMQCFIDSSIHWFTRLLIHGLIGLFGQLCMDSFMSFPWRLNHGLLIRWCTSQFQQLTASASQKLSYRPLISYSLFLFSNLPSLRGPGTTCCVYIYMCVCLKIIYTICWSKLINKYIDIHIYPISIYILHTFIYHV